MTYLQSFGGRTGTNARTVIIAQHSGCVTLPVIGAMGGAGKQLRNNAIIFMARMEKFEKEKRKI